MWSYLTRSFISPLSGYVENKAGYAEASKPRKITLLFAPFGHIAGFGKARHAEHRA
jgi:hypothetical protein